MTKKGKIILFSNIASVVLICLILSLFYYGILKLNNPSENDYPVRGVDVSSYQGKIDWNVLADQNISFAFIKATEGSGYTDPNFAENYSAAIETNLRVGAYHFFSFESHGKTQADNFRNSVYKYENMLPPVVDVEYYGKFKSHSDIDVGNVRTELSAIIEELKKEYGMDPIIYAAQDTYRDIIEGYFDDCDIWIRSVYTCVPKDIKWSFWQYTNRQKLKGYKGSEKYIDMNVFNGTEEEFEKYGKISN